MSLFNELLHTIKQVCDAKEREIEDLKNEIAFLKRERAVIIKRYEEGNFEALDSYFGIEK